MADLIQEAAESRLEVERSQINLDSSKILLKGDRNGLLPNLQAFAELTNHGLAGSANPLYTGNPADIDKYFVGGEGNALSQILRRNFPDYSAGFSLNIPFRNRASQADYVTDQLQLRQLVELLEPSRIGRIDLDHLRPIAVPPRGGRPLRTQHQQLHPALGDRAWPSSV